MAGTPGRRRGPSVASLRERAAVLLVSAANTEPLFGLEVAAIDFDGEDQFRLATEAALWKLAATTCRVILGRVGAVCGAAPHRPD